MVIGVDQTGHLPKLTSASKGARAVAEWLLNEGYDVECLTDESGPVHAAHIEEAVSRFVTLPPRYHLLVVYFSGHGFWHARSDLWLLSGAPTKTTDAINLDGAMDLARYSGIPNVVFISDACRSIPDSRVGAKVVGIDAFPNYAEISTISKIDVFKATSEALSAYEGEIDGKRHSILTYALLSAFKKPEPAMVRQLNVGTEQLYVVPNRALEKYLQKKVDAILEHIDINLTQCIEANVPSDDDVYIACVRGRVQPFLFEGPERLEERSTESPGRAAAAILNRTLTGGSQLEGAGADEMMTEFDQATESKVASRMPSEAVEHFETQAGFLVHGARIARAVAARGANHVRVDLLESGDGGQNPALIRLGNLRPAVSVALQTEDGRCAILAGLDGYIGHATFDGRGLVNVNYVPSANHWRWDLFRQVKDKIDRLRALVATAVEDNRFHVRSEAEAEELGRRIRVEKAIDPTLGLYAAYAFLQAGNIDAVNSVHEYMLHDLQTDLFDVKALATRHARKSWQLDPVVPFCPMLTQTWNLLRPRGIPLHPVLQAALPHLCNALWTTFTPEGAIPILQAIERGELL